MLIELTRFDGSHMAVDTNNIIYVVSQPKSMRDSEDHCLVYISTMQNTVEVKGTVASIMKLANTIPTTAGGGYESGQKSIERILDKNPKWGTRSFYDETEEGDIVIDDVDLGKEPMTGDEGEGWQEEVIDLLSANASGDISAADVVQQLCEKAEAEGHEIVDPYIETGELPGQTSIDDHLD